MFELLGVPPQALFGQLLLGLINGAFYAMLSLGLAVIFGMLNIINFAHGALYMMGAFVAYFLLNLGGINYWQTRQLTHALEQATLGQGKIRSQAAAPIGAVWKTVFIEGR